MTPRRPNADMVSLNFCPAVRRIGKHVLYIEHTRKAEGFTGHSGCLLCALPASLVRPIKPPDAPADT